MKNNLLILIQSILTIIAIIIGIMSIFINEILFVFYITLGLTLFVLSYNNYKIFNKKYMTSIYLGFGFLMIMNAILEVINGI